MESKVKSKPKRNEITAFKPSLIQPKEPYKKNINMTDEELDDKIDHLETGSGPTQTPSQLLFKKKVCKKGTDSQIFFRLI